MASTGCSAFSQDGQYYAFCGNDGKLKIWETVSGRLKHEYTPNRHLSSPCSVIGWIFVSPQSAGNVSVNIWIICSSTTDIFTFSSFFRFIFTVITILCRQFLLFLILIHTNIYLPTYNILFQILCKFPEDYIKRISYISFYIENFMFYDLMYDKYFQQKGIINEIIYKHVYKNHNVRNLFL